MASIRQCPQRPQPPPPVKSITAGQSRPWGGGSADAAPLQPRDKEATGARPGGFFHAAASGRRQQIETVSDIGTSHQARIHTVTGNRPQIPPLPALSSANRRPWSL
ncbi:hypothetical protein GCM10010205_81970 [Streptomyces nojiriensis]|nr:hypothetical protein GCM10010205_81970 [Streptomyces nojiriensis]